MKQITKSPLRAGLRTRALRLVKQSAAAADGLRPPRRGVVVLIYHRVGGGSGLEVDLTDTLFAAQIEAIAMSGRATALDDALAILAKPEPPLHDPVVVTFDDGTADFADVAVPILERFGVPATLYVATRFVEEGVAFPNDGEPVTWAALRDAVATGLVTIGSHTHSHALLDRLEPGAVDDELDRSRELIEDRLGVSALHFAYPKAQPGSSASDAAVRARFESAALAGTRPNPYGRTDPFRLSRSPIQVSDGMAFFGRKLEGGMALEDTLRRTLDRRRYAGATT